MSIFLALWTDPRLLIPWISEWSMQQQPLLDTQQSFGTFTSTTDQGLASMDPMIKDSKILRNSSTMVALALVVVYSVAIMPLWLFVLVPIALLSAAYRALFRAKADKQSRQGVDSPLSPTKSERVYDLVLYGATGFTGTLAARYLAKQYRGQPLKWAISGRSRSKLEDLRRDIGLDETSMPIIVADADDLASIGAMVAQTKVVITTAGPFDVFGHTLVRACAELGTHYCDITGETDFVRRMIGAHDDTARRTGAKLVFHCGHDCIPWDLLVFELSGIMKKKGETLVDFSAYDELCAKASAGTINTAKNVIFGRKKKMPSSLDFDPLLKTSAGSKSTNKVIVDNVSSIRFSRENRSWVGPFYMASVMANCVRRSNALLNYSSNLRYCEALVYPNVFAAVIDFYDTLLLGTYMFSDPFLNFMLPSSGPSDSFMDKVNTFTHTLCSLITFMDKGFLKVTACGLGSSGSKAKAVIYFPTDVGYRDTARMLVESGLVLALQHDAVARAGVQGGCHTPASALGAGGLLLQRLVSTGSSFYVVESAAAAEGI